MLTLCVFVGLFYASQATKSIQYEEVSTCATTENTLNSFIETKSVRSHVECAVSCSRHTECLAYVLSPKPYTCTLHSRPLSVQTCSQYPDSGYKRYNNVNATCKNGGVFDSGSSKCTCFDGYIGDKCESLMKDCAEGMASGHYSKPSKLVLHIHPDGAPAPIKVYCRMNWGGRTYLMHRDKGLVSFNRPMSDYKAGFGDLNGEFWLGLDNMHYITSYTSKLGRKFVVQVTTVMPENTYPFRQHYYRGFKIEKESMGYAFTFDSHFPYGLNAIGDCLQDQIGKKFTTTDVDNDDVAGSNCASVHEGGWWFTGCGQCNPTGPMIKPTDGYLRNIPNEVFWKPLISNYSLTKVHLFVAP